MFPSSSSKKKIWISFIIFWIACCYAFSQELRRTPVVKVVERVGPAIVNISTERLVTRESYPSWFDQEFFEEFFGRFHPRVYKTRSLGSGVIVDPQGFIVTNHHVIQRATKITVTLYDKSNFYAQVIASDEKNDLALLKIHAGFPLPSVAWGNSSDILIGETAIALGNPFGLQNSVTTGVISATNRTIALEGKILFDDFIQTDAAINPGNSGGALLNIYGRLIGINTLIYARGQGLGFAIPAKRVREVIGRLLDYRKLKNFWLGLELEELNKSRLNWQVRIAQVIKNSPAHRARIPVGAFLIAVDEKPVTSLFSFRSKVFLKQPGDRIKLELRFHKKYLTYILPVVSLPFQIRYPTIWKRIGISAHTSRQGIVVDAVRKNSPAARVGVLPQDVIIALSGYRVQDLEDLRYLVTHLGENEAASIILIRKGRPLRGTLILE